MYAKLVTKTQLDYNFFLYAVACRNRPFVEHLLMVVGAVPFESQVS